MQWFTVVTRDVSGTDNMEKITIRLEADNKSICVESLQAGGGARVIRSVTILFIS